jgi:D-psicose/D-tagatose/L-ribulose 3-epimerase
VVKFSISDIAWAAQEARTILPRLRDLGVTQIEAAPTRLGAWEDIKVEVLKEYRSLCEDSGITINSFQSIFFGKAELQLLGDKSNFRKFIEHLKLVLSLGAEIEISVVVFGSPANRQLCGLKTPQLTRVINERLWEVAEHGKTFGVTVALESTPTAYGGECLTSLRETYEVCEFVNHPSLAFHIDTGCAILSGDNLAGSIHNYAAKIRHFHVSQPYLGEFTQPHCAHSIAAKCLRAVDYSGTINLEMKRPPAGVPVVVASVEMVKNIYMINQ